MSLPAYNPFLPLLNFWGVLIPGFADLTGATPRQAPARPAPGTDLAHSEWALDGIDCDGTDWHGTKITFVTEKEGLRAGHKALSGVIDWVSDAGESARELFLGERDGSHLKLEGFELRTESTEFVLGTYEAELSPCGNLLLNGRWLGENNAADAQGWSAERLCAAEDVAAASDECPASNGTASTRAAPSASEESAPGGLGDMDFGEAYFAAGPFVDMFPSQMMKLSLAMPFGFMSLTAQFMEQSTSAWQDLALQFTYSASTRT